MNITLQQLIDMLQSLPPEQLSKPISYLDLAYMRPEDLEELKIKLLENTESDIGFCQN